MTDVQMPSTTQKACKIRNILQSEVSPDMLLRNAALRNLSRRIQPFDEIDIPMDTGETVTVVCAYVEPTGARFVFKDCWDKGVMNDIDTNKGGYYESKGRKHVLEDIYPHLPQEWQDIITPRHIVEGIGGQQVEYDDPLWLPSATDVFGKPEDGLWNDLDDSAQLPIFVRERDRVKEFGNNGTCPYWLRSASATTAPYFCLVSISGSARSTGACVPIGFAPGFDIRAQAA